MSGFELPSTFGLGSEVDAEDLMGGNGCTWNRRDVTADLQDAASQLWSSLTQDFTADLGIASVSPMSGQYEENFWLPASVCAPELADENTCFVRGETSEYELPCIVQDTAALQTQFTGTNDDEVMMIDFETFNCTAVLPKNSGLSYVVGAELKVSAKAEVNVVDEVVDKATVDLHSDHFNLKSCTISLRTAETPLQVGDTFEYTLILSDAQPSLKIIMIGSIVGGVSALLLFCFTCWCCFCRRRRRK